MSELDIVIPVYNEGKLIAATLDALRRMVKTPSRIFICYDHPDDDTLAAIRSDPAGVEGLAIEFVRNRGVGPHAAIMSGFGASKAPYVVVFPVDDDFNAGILDGMVSEARSGADIVCASRFMPGGCMVGCPWLKAVLVRAANFTLYHLARLPSHDATSGFRLFSRRVLEDIAIESTRGFCYSIELLVKCHRLRWPVVEVPAQWFERKQGQSRFRVAGWLLAYLRWYAYAFSTTFLRRSPRSVTMNPTAMASPSMVRS